MSYSRSDRYITGRYRPSSSLYGGLGSGYMSSSSSASTRPLRSSTSRYASSYNTYPSKPLAAHVYSSRPSRYTSSDYSSLSSSSSSSRPSAGYSTSSRPSAGYSTSSRPSAGSSSRDWSSASSSSRDWSSSSSKPVIAKIESDTAITTGGPGSVPHKLTTTPAPAPAAPAAAAAAAIKKIDLMISANSEKHHTDMYEMCQESYTDDITGKQCSAQLVVRRGQKFTVKLTMNKDFSSKDQLRVVATIGSMPLISKGTAVEMLANKKGDDKQWSASIASSNAKEVELSVQAPATCAIGKWDLSFDTVSVSDDEAFTSLMDEPVKTHAYILFNAWSKDDAVYMEKDDWRDEYVLNDSGKVYRGDSVRLYGMPWNFGQFESVALQTALYLLDELSEIAITSRGSPVTISRELSALVNSADENGVLMGNWSGDYSGGVSPTKWTGTPAILLKYMETKKAVKYGQCWVFSAVMTGICRSIGLPTRSVTNYNSAHDTDGSLTIDNHFNSEGEPLSELDSDSIWNFHVWNECWMSRPELAAGYGGWQAVDATPQEMSGGVYRAGPASVLAIKIGDVGCNYDAKFIFAEVNADRVYWIKEENGKFSRQLVKDVVGKCISTKAVGPSKVFNSNYYNPDREDITHQYKFPEGSDEERTSVLRAATWSTKPQVYFDENQVQDVTFGILSESRYSTVEVGSDFEIPLFIENESNEKRSVRLTVTLSSVYYTGVYRKKLKKEKFNVVVLPKSEERVAMVVKASDYLDDLVDFGYAMKIDYMGTVTETKQLLASQDNFRLRTIVPDVVASKTEAKVGENFNVAVTFKNPLKKSLTGCCFTFESAGNLKQTTVEISNVSAGGTARADLDIEAKRAGECIIITAFECNELGDVQGQASVSLKKK